jgi:multidrug efflux pump subunit AcrA (membrane-fusion protein)
VNTTYPKMNADDPKVTPSVETRLLRLTPPVLVLLALGVGILPRLKAHAALRTQTESFSIPVVSVVHPTPAPAVQRIELPADVQAYQEASIFARTNGYLAHWYKDIGTQVPAGELLAYIETPEVDAQLEQAQADEHTARVQYDISKVTADRWVALLKTNAVSNRSGSAGWVIRSVFSGIRRVPTQVARSMIALTAASSASRVSGLAMTWATPRVRAVVPAVERSARN